MKKLFVGNLPYQANESELHEWFQLSGITVDTINFIRDRSSGEPRGFGFVEIASDDEADRAVQSCNGREFQGRTLVVNEARPRPDAAGRPRTGTSFGSRGAMRGARNW